MCSNQEGDFPEKAIKSLDELTCAKCKRKDVPVVATRVNDAFCRDCFLVYAVHKFRSAIGKSKAILPRDKVLLAFSGGPMSSALLHFVQQGIKEERLRFSVNVLHISELSLVSISEEERLERMACLVNRVKERGFPLFWASIEQAMEMNIQEQTPLNSKPICEAASCDTDSVFTTEQYCPGLDQLKRVLDALPSVSAREEFLRVLRNQLLTAVARQQGCNKVMVADTASLLSVRIMTDIAKGRGAQVSMDTAITDSRYGDVVVVRPLRELNEKEVQMYNKLYNVCHVSLPSIADRWTPSNSIERLTASFIAGLDSDYPSTVPNIVRTSAKLSDGDMVGHSGRCAMCQSALDTDVGEASALMAVQVSERLQGRVNARDSESSNSLASSVSACLCYGCLLMVKNVKDISVLPNHVRSAVQVRRKMRETISEFLIEKDESSSS